MKQKKNIILLILILLIFQFFKLPYSAYNLLKWSHENRMVQSYGYCEKESWGFYDYVTKRFNLKDKQMMVINHEGHVTLEFLLNFKSSVGEHYSIDENKKSKIDYYLIVNFQSVNDETIFDYYTDLSNFRILYRYNNCYLLSNV
tara:strand:- start:261 stop:692 length:432 start_codon:yes stop_codon:yes gene_type:complete